MSPEEIETLLSGDALNILREQFQTLLIFARRSAVQRQFFAFGLVLLAAYGATQGLLRLTRRLTGLYLTDRDEDEEHEPTRLERWMPKIGLLYFPIAGLIGLQVANAWFAFRGQSFGLLGNASTILWLFLGYRIVVILLYVFFTPVRIRIYHHAILTPLIVFAIAAQIIGNIFDLRLIRQIEVVRFLETPISLGNLFSAVVVFYGFIALSWLVRDALTSFVFPRIEGGPGALNSILTLSRYAILIVGFIISFGSLGFDLTTLTLIGGGLFVGIGFGLQQIVANFISGIVLLFEQSLRPGDIIDIDGEIGIVEKLSIRSTTVRTLENVEVIVPNERFLTSSVTTYTGSDRLVRGSLDVGAGYDSDPKLVRDLLLEAANRHGQILKKPEPFVLFVNYGASSIDFRINYWIDRPERLPFVKSDLFFIVWELFAKHEIEIPFPQHDLNLRRGWENLGDSERDHHPGDPPDSSV